MHNNKKKNKRQNFFNTSPTINPFITIITLKYTLTKKGIYNDTKFHTTFTQQRTPI